MPLLLEPRLEVVAADREVKAGLFGPRDMAEDIRERIAADIREVAGDPAIAARLLSTGQLVSPGRPAEFAASIDEQRGVVARIAKEMGIKPGQPVQ